MKLFNGVSSTAAAVVASSLLRRHAIAVSLKPPSVDGGMRRTAPGDFDEFNKIFENASILLPEEYKVSERVAFVDLNLMIRDIKCYEIAIGDVVIAHEQVSSTAYQVNIELSGLDLTCEMGYNYTYGVLSGEGWLQISTADNMASSTMNFVSEDFDTQPPTESTMGECISNVEITRMDFEEDLVSEILEVFQGLIRNVVENAIGDVACDELSVIGTNLVANMVDIAGANLMPYQGNLGEAVTDPLYDERNLFLPTDLVPLNLQDTDGDVGKMFNQILKFLDNYMGASISDPDGSTSTGSDLAVNMFLRSVFLDDNRALTVDPSRFEMMEPVLFEGHDRITKFSVTLNEARIYGLDTFTRFNPFRSIGRHTIQNELTWDSLTVQFDITVDIMPSNLDDAILQDPTSPGISERINIDFTVDKVEVEASLLLVLDETAMGAMVLGPLFYSEHLLPCLLSVVHEAKLSGFDVDPKYVNNPTLTGFLSPGLDRVVTDSIEAAFAMYSGVLRDAIPNIFQTSVRDLINSFFIDAYMEDMGKTVCPEVTAPEGFVDFRKLFDSDAKTYGDLPPMWKKVLDDELRTLNNETGRPRINEALIAPFTKAQSGVEGTLEFPVDLVSFLSEDVSKFGLDSVGIRLFNPKVENMNTMGNPMELLKPNATSGMVIENYATLGFDPDRFGFVLKALLATEGDPLLTMTNEMDISLELAGSEAFASIMAKIDATNLFRFPLKHITNMQCWLNTLGTPEAAGFAIQTLLLSTPDVTFNVTCTKCTSPSLSIFPDVLGSFEDAGVSDVLQQRLVKLFLSLLESDFVQSYIDALLTDAAVRCPHSLTYIGPDSSSDFKLPTFPSLPLDSLETVAFATTVVLEIATVITAESHQSYDTNMTSMLSGQNELTGQDKVRLIDFTSLGTTVGEWAQSGIDNVIQYLNEIISDPKGPNGKDLRVNSLLRSSLLGDTGYYSMSFYDQSVVGYGLGISFKEFNIIGLDTITELGIFDAVAPQTLRNKITWKNLGFEFVVSLFASDSDGNSNDRSVKTMQDISVTIELSDVNLSLAMFLAMDVDILSSLPLSSILEMKSILACLLQAAHAASVTELEVSVGKIEKIDIKGFLSNEVSSAATQSTQVLMQKYGDKIASSLPKFFDSTVRTMLNSWVKYHMAEETAAVCRPSASGRSFSQNEFVDLRDLLWTPLVSQALGGSGLSQYGDMFGIAMGFIRNLLKVDEVTGLSGLNDAAITPLTDEGSISYADDIFYGGTRITVGALDANVKFRVFDAMVENLDTIGAPLELFSGSAGKAYDLNNTLTFGVKDEPLRFSTKLLLSVEGDDEIQIRNEIDLSLDLFNANVIAATMTKIAENKFFNFPLRDILNINCWLATIPAPSLDSRGLREKHEDPTASLAELEAHVGSLVMKAQCTNCSSPRMNELTDLLSSTQAQDDTTEVANALLNYVTQLIGGNFLQVQIDRLLIDAGRKCPHSPDYDPDATPVEYEPFEDPDIDYTTSYLILLGVAIGLIVVVSAIILGVRCIVRRRHRKWVVRLPPHQFKELAMQQRQESEMNVRLNLSTRSMFRSHDIPCLLRWVVPAILLLNILFFLSGHLSLGATVNVQANVAGEKFKIDNFFEFSIAQSTVDIWNAGGKALAILILIFSGIWPYTKILMTLALWFTSPTQVSVTRRGSILLWLDWLAKWSFIDIFVLVISIAAFRVSIQSPDKSYLPDDFYSVEMMVIPQWGLYANMIAQLISQLSSHVIIYYHRQIVMKANERFSREDVIVSSVESQSSRSRVSLDDSPGAGSVRSGFDKRQVPTSLSRHQFSRPHRGETEKLVVRSFIGKFLVLAAFIFTVLVVLGCILPSFSLEVLGLVGIAVEFGQDFEDATIDHSVFSVLKVLFEQASYLGTTKDYIGLGALSVIFVSTILLVPIVLSIALLRQWFMSSTIDRKRTMSYRIEIMQAWQYLEVYLVAVCVTSWQLGSVSNYMINSYCENLGDLFAQMVYYGVLRDEDAQCFSVSASIEKGSFVLAGASVVLSFLCSFVVKAVAQYLREEAEPRRPIQYYTKALSYSDRTSRTDDDEDVVAENGYSGTIHPVPVFFTDSFRWLLRPDPNVTSSARALFAESASSHWSLPEATAIVDDSTDDVMIKGTYVSDLGPTSDSDRKIKEAARSGGSLRSFGPDAVSDGSRDSGRLSSGRMLTYVDEDVDKKSHKSTQRRKVLKSDEQNSASSLGQRSVQSKMESMDTYRDETSTLSENESLAYSVPSSMGRSTLPPPQTEVESPSPTATYKRKAPPPTGYRLSHSQLKEPPSTPSVSVTAAAVEGGRSGTRNSPSPPPALIRKASSSYFKRQEESSTASVSQPKNLKKPPPPSRHEEFINGFGSDYDFVVDDVDDGGEIYTVDDSNDSMFMDDESADVYFGENYSQHSHRGFT